MDAISNMKAQVISDFNNHIKKLNIGHPIDLTNTLHKISFIQSYQYLDKIDPIYEYLINV